MVKDLPGSQRNATWLIENPVVSLIPGAKNSRQAVENAGSLSFRLTPAEVEALERVTQGWRPAGPVP